MIQMKKKKKKKKISSVASGEASPALINEKINN